MVYQYDVVVIGSGTAGQTAAHDVNSGGLKTALVEKSQYPGGTCALRGCQPKKWFYEVAETMARSRGLAGKGIASPPRTLWSDILAQKNRFTHGIPDGTVEGLMSEGIDFFEGAATFVAEDALQVEDDLLRAEFFIVAAGATPMPLPVEGKEHVVTSDDFLELEALPRRIFFVGGGFISFEFAHFAAWLGPENSEIVIGEVADRPLSLFDSEMVDLLVKASRDAGIEVLTGVDIQAVEKRRNEYAVILGGGKTLKTDLVVHGAGRVPDIESLNLSVAGVDFTKKGIPVDLRMRTSNPKIFAVGDCAATLQLARVADFEAHAAAENILSQLKGENKPARYNIDYGAVPALLFTCPQYGMVGKTEDALKKEGAEYKKSFGKDLGWPTYRRVGLEHAAYKILTGPDNRILGAHILSDNASGLINTIKMAMVNDIGADRLCLQSILTPYPSRESDIIYMLSPFL